MFDSFNFTFLLLPPERTKKVFLCRRFIVEKKINISFSPFRSASSSSVSFSPRRSRSVHGERRSKNADDQGYQSYRQMAQRLHGEQSGRQRFYGWNL